MGAATKNNDFVKYGTSYKSVTNQVVSIAETIVSPAANTNGLIVWLANIVSYNGAGISKASLLVKNSTPANILDGDVILSPNFVSGGYCGAQLVRPVYVPAGRGLYYVVAVTEMDCTRSVNYTML